MGDPVSGMDFAKCRTVSGAARTVPTYIAGSDRASLTMPKKNQVRNWNRKDVARWLEKRNLLKFAPLFLKNGVVGSDIVESKLTFLYGEDVQVGDREQLLAEIYMLLHPDSPKLRPRSTPSPSLQAVHPTDREKFEAALQVARSQPSLQSPPPVVLIGCRSRSPAPLTFTKTLTTLPVPQQGLRSESDSEAKVSTTPPPSPGRKYLKRKSTPAVHDYLHRGIIQNISLFELLQDEDQVCLQCVRVQRSDVESKFGFSYQTLPDGCMLVTGVRSSSVSLQAGDRILELNGILLPGHKGSKSTVEGVLHKSTSLEVAVVRPQSRFSRRRAAEKSGKEEETKLRQEVVMGEVKWRSLRQLLTTLQQAPFDPYSLTDAKDLETIKQQATLEMEVEELQRNSTQLANTISDLQMALKAKEEELEVTKYQRDRAVDTLRKRLLNRYSPRSASSVTDEDEDYDLRKPPRKVASSQDLHALFFEQMKMNLTAMENSDSSKEDVLEVLRELTRAAQRHAHFVDGLIAFVSDRAPWMIDELNALQDASELPETAQSSSASSDFAEGKAITV